MRRPSTYTQQRGGLDVMMTPMIDVVFLLLVFFLWTASFRIVEHVLPGALSTPAAAAPAGPRDPPPPEADFDEIVVRIQWAGDRPSWTLNESPVASLDELRARLRQIAQIKADAPVILHPDPLVPMGSVIDAYDISRLVGFEKVQLVASQEA